MLYIYFNHDIVEMVSNKLESIKSGCKAKSILLLCQVHENRFGFFGGLFCFCIQVFKNKFWRPIINTDSIQRSIFDNFQFKICPYKMTILSSSFRIHATLSRKKSKSYKLDLYFYVLLLLHIQTIYSYFPLSTNSLPQVQVLQMYNAISSCVWLKPKIQFYSH